MPNSLAALAIAAVATSALAPGLATAEPSPRQRDASQLVTDDCAKARRAGKACVLDVPAEPVHGTVPTAGDAAIGGFTFGPATSMIRLRRDFIPELVAALDHLR